MCAQRHVHYINRNMHIHTCVQYVQRYACIHIYICVPHVQEHACMCTHILRMHRNMHTHTCVYRMCRSIRVCTCNKCTLVKREKLSFRAKFKVINTEKNKVEKIVFCNYRSIWFELESLMFIMVWIWNVPQKARVLKSWLQLMGSGKRLDHEGFGFISGFIHCRMHDWIMSLGRERGSEAKR